MSENLFEWMIASPWATLVVVVFQISLVAAIAGLVSSRISRVDAGRTHVVWLTASCLILVILPIHMLTGGWPIELASANPNAVPTADSSVSPEHVNGGDSTNENGLLVEASRLPAGFREEAGSQDELAVAQPQASVGLEGVAFSDALAADAAPSVGFVAGNESLPNRLHVGTLMISLYAIGVLFFAIRMVIGMVRLRDASSTGDPVDQPTREIAARIAESLGLSDVPQIVRTDRTSMPLVFGLFRSSVLVPVDFESWGQDEIQSTLFHELTHVLRKDSVGQLCASINQVLYWFHPAVWFVGRRLAQSREWATDRDVVQHSSAVGNGLTSERYAESLLNIVSRFRRVDSAGFSLGRAAIAMSRQTEIENRLKLILTAAPRLSRFRVAWLKLMVALLAIVAIATTVRVKRSLAVEPPQNVTTESEPQKEKDSIADARETETAEVAVGDDENDLIARVLGCEVTSVTGDDYGFIVNASGKVVSPTGDPVEGATVVLADSFGRLAMNDPTRYLYSEERYRLRAPDINSRTVTNERGEFQFLAIKVAAAPLDNRSDNWSGSIVAAVPGVGIAKASLYVTKSSGDLIAPLDLKLIPTHSVSGRLQTPDGKPLSGAIVDVRHLLTPSRDDSRDVSRFDLYTSQLTPRMVTDESGRFEFSNLPTGVVASIQAFHPDWENGYAAIRTNADVPLGELKSARQYLPSKVVVDSPAIVVMDPGVRIAGKVVDEDGNGVEGVNVNAPIYLRSKTDSDGTFSMRLPTPTVSDFLNEDRSSFRLMAHVAPGGGYASRRFECSREQLTEKAPITINLEKAALVTGRFVDSDGSAIKGIEIVAVGASFPSIWTSGEEGRFELNLALGRHRLVFGTSQPGYDLPAHRLSRLSEKEAGRSLHRDIEIDSVERVDLGPIVVPRSQTYQVIASLPDGSPAVGATAMIRDEVARNPNAPEPYRQVPEVVEKSLPQATNSLGRVTLIPQGLLSEKAFVDVKYIDGEAAFNGNIKLNTASDGVINLVLDASSIVEGRVLLDGAPVAGARVQVSQSTPAQRTINGMTMTFFTASENQFVVTDSQGVYRAALPTGKQCHVSLSKVPNVSINSGIGYGARPAADGKLRVQDFELIRGDQEIAGLVVDSSGDPIVKARVEIRRDQNVTPSFWVDHESESQPLTDSRGRFHLKHVPRGTYQLSVRAERVEGAPRAERVSTIVPAVAGQMDLEVTLNVPITTEIPRLVPKRIIESKP